MGEARTTCRILLVNLLENAYLESREGDGRIKIHFRIYYKNGRKVN
jgi:hypothetical protein